MKNSSSKICTIDRNQWETLFQNALIPTMEASPVWAEGVLRNFSVPGETILAAYDQTERHSGLTAIMPMTQHSWRSGYPGTVLRTKASDFTYTGVPLIDRDYPTQAFLSLMVHGKQKYGADGVVFNNFPDDEVLANMLKEVEASGLQYHFLERRERAKLDCNQTFGSWFNHALSTKRRKEYRRLRARLNEQGKLVSETKKAHESIDSWIEQFLQIEATGWKGRRGTAIASTSTNTAFFREILPQIDKRGELVFWRLTLDGIPVAMLFSVIANDRAWLVKIAYDERYHRYSPGVLIILDATAWFLENRRVSIVDSCAQPNHPMIDHLWREKIQLADIMVSTPSTSKVKFAMLVRIEQMKRLLRGIAKAIYNKMMARKSV